MGTDGYHPILAPALCAGKGPGQLHLPAQGTLPHWQLMLQACCCSQMALQSVVLAMDLSYKCGFNSGVKVNIS